MKNKVKDVLESIIYVFLIMIVIFSSAYGSIYIRLIPLLFMLGIVGNAVFERGIMTTILGMVVSFCINYLKTPNDMIYVIFSTGIMGFSIILGELFGKYLLKLIKEKENRTKKKVVVDVIIIGLTFTLSLGIHSALNGSIVTYQECKKSLQKYLEENYTNSKKFVEVSSSYYIYKNPRYVFYLSNIEINEIYRFTVYENEQEVVIDEYKQEAQKNILAEVNSKITSCIMKLEDPSKYDKIEIKAKYVQDDKICLDMIKKVQKVDKEATEEYAKEIANYLEDIQDSGVCDKIEQVNISLMCETNPNTSLVSIIYLDEYHLAIQEKTDISYKYIIKALNMEYDY